MMMRSPGASGFTLVEVLVALLIIAALPSLVLNAADRLHGLKTIEDTMIAAAVARNQLARVRLANRLNGDRPDRISNGDESMVGREWYWRATSEPTEVPGYFRIEVIAGADRALKQPLTEVVVFFGVAEATEIAP
jgi:type II secretion system protein I